MALISHSFTMAERQKYIQRGTKNAISTEQPKSYQGSLIMPQQVAQLVLTLNDLGQITAEHWTNGQREVERILSLHQITAILQDQKLAIKTAADLEREKARRESVARHNRVYAGVAVKHGILMAKRTVGEPIKPGRAADPDKAPAEPKKVAASVDSFEDIF